MSDIVSLTVADGHRLTACRSDPAGAAKGGIVILHAVYGLTDHVGDVCDQWAAAGFAAMAPALFDRRGAGRVHPYSRAGADAGIEDYAALSEQDIFADVAACEKALRPSGKVAISGFCTGGTWAWRAAAALPFDAQVNFYGSHVPRFLNLKPRCPTLMHYGDKDTIMPFIAVEGIISACPAVEVLVYKNAGHAFFNPAQDHYDAVAARQAWDRSVAFMEQTFKG
jgi:carboxymethylenebutenolidase